MMEIDTSAKKFRSINIYRPISHDVISLPFSLRSVGHCWAHKGWQDSPQKKTFVQIFWSVVGEGEFHLDQEKFILKENEGFVYFPGQRHLIWAYSDYWEYRFFTIDGSLASELVKGFNLKNQPFICGPCPVNDFIALGKDIMDATPKGLVHASAKAFELLSKASGIKRVSKYSKLISESIQMISDELSNSGFNVNQLALKLQVHRSQLARQFKQETGLTPIEYLISSRVRHGLKLLSETRKPIGEIARECGYLEADYFAKAIKKATGNTPREVRR